VAELKLLTIDTSSTTCSVAITSGGRLVVEYLLNQDRPMSGQLLKSVEMAVADAAMTFADLDGFGVALGPGSFTGLRVGVATVKGLALAANKPVAGFSSLAMLAMNLPWAGYQVCAMLDARKSEVYTAIYRCTDQPVALRAESVIAPGQFLTTINETTIFVGEGALRYREQITAALGALAIFPPSTCHVPRASSGALLAAAAFARGDLPPLPALNPVYIRPSEAELAKMQRETL
jgi:tRNA threonylcarbamoyladenosine biosynthesis protein TsaB